MPTKLTREIVYDRLIKSYNQSYNIEEINISDVPVVAKCTFHAHNARYVLVKKAELWSADTNEHLYIFSVPKLSLEIYENCQRYAYDLAMPLIDPKPGHMYTYITALFICDNCTQEALKALKKCHIKKSFKFSLRGWMEFHTALINLEAHTVAANSLGKGNVDFLEKIIM